jgi:hypothetical protein
MIWKMPKVFLNKKSNKNKVCIFKVLITTMICIYFFNQFHDKQPNNGFLIGYAVKLSTLSVSNQPLTGHLMFQNG